VKPAAYPETVSGFQAYLSDCGVRSISAADLTHPNHPRIAARLGYRDFLPPRDWWPRGTALALLAQNISSSAGPVRVRNWWRPASYNSGVGGAKGGDHPTANAVDLDYQRPSDRMRAERYLRDLDRRCPWMELSLGLGPQTTHVGIGSPRGRREWHYPGWRPAPGPRIARVSGRKSG
jgi:hypothetical protein